MPRGNKTGPMGDGPMSGRAAGYCADWGVPGCANPGSSRGWGVGMGIGCGFRGGRSHAWDYNKRMAAFNSRNPFGWPRAAIHSQTIPEDEQYYLKNQEKILKQQLDEVRNRLNHIAGKDKAD